MDIFNRKRVAILMKENRELIEALEWNQSSLIESEILQNKSLFMTPDKPDERYSLLLNAWSKIAASIKWNNHNALLKYHKLKN